MAAITNLMTHSENLILSKNKNNPKNNLQIKIKRFFQKKKKEK